MDTVKPELSLSTQNLSGTVAQYLFNVGADVGDAPIGIDGPRHIGKVGQQPAVLLFAFTKSFLCLLALAEFDTDAEHTRLMIDINAHACEATRNALAVLGKPGGIGFGMADALAEAGADVCIWGTNPTKNASAAEKLKRHGRKVHT